MRTIVLYSLHCYKVEQEGIAHTVGSLWLDRAPGTLAFCFGNIYPHLCIGGQVVMPLSVRYCTDTLLALSSNANEVGTALPLP